MQIDEKSRIFDSFRKHVETIHDINESDWEFLREHFKLCSFKKGELILEPGKRADVFYYIGSGLVKRYFISQEGKHFITNFDGENRIISDFASFILKRSSTIYIQALEDTTLLMSDFDVAEALRQKSPIWERIGRLIAESRYIEKCEREYNLLYYKAKERLEIFEKEFADYKHKISQKDIASYLGITPESLNRLIKNSKP